MTIHYYIIHIVIKGSRSWTSFINQTEYTILFIKNSHNVQTAVLSTLKTNQHKLQYSSSDPHRKPWSDAAHTPRTKATRTRTTYVANIDHTSACMRSGSLSTSRQISWCCLWWDVPSHCKAEPSIFLIREFVENFWLFMIIYLFTFPLKVQAYALFVCLSWNLSLFVSINPCYRMSLTFVLLCV